MQRRQFLQHTTLVAASLWLAPTRAAAVRTGLVYDDRFLDHVITPDHPESPRRLETLRAHFRERELWSRLVPIRSRQNPGAAIEAIHTAKHVSAIAERYPDSHGVAGQWRRGGRR